MPWTQEDIDVLKASIKSGTKEVQFKDRRVTYHSLAEMMQLLSSMQSEVNASLPASSVLRTTYATHSKD